MPEYDNTDRGVLFKNDRKESDKHADYRGSLNVDGAEYWIDAWIKTKKDGSGKFMSLSVKPKQAKQAPAQSEYAKQAQASAKASLAAQAPAGFEDVPF